MFKLDKNSYDLDKNSELKKSDKFCGLKKIGFEKFRIKIDVAKIYRYR